MYPVKLSVPTRKLRRQTVALGGLDRTREGAEGALVDSRGLSLAQWPCLSQRKGRKRVRRAESCTELFAWDKLCTVEGTDLCYDGRPVGTVTEGEKQFAVVGSKLCVFPDKKYLDLTTGAFAELGARAVGVSESAVFTADSLDLNNSAASLGVYRASSRVSPSTMTYWTFREEDLVWDPETGWGEMELTLVPGTQLHTLEPGTCFMLDDSPVRGDRFPAYFTAGGGAGARFDRWGDYGYLTGPIVWEDSANLRPSLTLIPLERRNALRRNPQFGDLGFRVGDTVRISGCAAWPENNRTARIKAIEGTKLIFEGEVFFALGEPAEEGGEALPLEVWGEMGVVTVERWVPELDFVCECGNRLMGVSNADRTVYASALGDPTNFLTREGLASDGWQETAGTDGDFTGCTRYAGGALFWKEDCLHRLLGATPASFQLSTSQVPGLQAGCAGSMVILNEVLYYKSRDGVYAYAGATPRKISRALGEAEYDTAAAGGDSGGYHLSMRRRDTGAWEFLTYDPERKLWVREDDLACGRFVCLDGVLYALSGEDILMLGWSEDDDGAAIGWEAVFTPFTENVPERKYPSRLLMGLELAPGGWVAAEISRDGGPFRRVWSGHDPSATAAVIPLRPGRCRSWQLKLKGEGRCVIRDLTREFSLGGVG